MSAGIPIVRFYCPSSSRLPFRVYFPKTAAKKDTSRILSGMSRSMGSPHAGQIHDSHTLKTDWGQTVRASCWMRTASSVCRKVLVIDKVWNTHRQHAQIPSPQLVKAGLFRRNRAVFCKAKFSERKRRRSSLSEVSNTCATQVGFRPAYVAARHMNAVGRRRSEKGIRRLPTRSTEQCLSPPKAGKHSGTPYHSTGIRTR